MISDVLSHSAPCILRQYEFATLSSIKLVIFRVQLCFFLPYWASNGPLYNVTTARESVSVCGENVIRIKQLRMASFPLSMPTRNNAKYVIPTCCARICRRSLDFSRICFSLSPISFSLPFSSLQKFAMLNFVTNRFVTKPLLAGTWHPGQLVRS